MKVFTILAGILILVIVACFGGYFGGRSYINFQGPEYILAHPRLAKYFNLQAVCPTACVSGGVCGKNSKDYCNKCLAIQNGKGYAHDGSCKSKTAGWNTYKNFGIEFMYPNSKAWGLPQENISKKSPTITFGAHSPEEFSVDFYPFPGEFTGPKSDSHVKYAIKDITINSISGKEYPYTVEGGTINHFKVSLLSGGNLYTFTGNSSFMSRETFDTLVSTFKIDNSTAIQKDSQNGWDIYNNGDIYFEYPEKFDTKYASLQVQTAMARPGDSRFDKDGCYIVNAPKTVKPKTVAVNNIKFCYTTGTDVGAGQLYNSYYYSTYKNGYFYLVGYVVHTLNGCGAYQGTQDYQPCVDFQKNYDSVVTKPIQASIATFKFSK